MSLTDAIHIQATRDFINENPVDVQPGRRAKIPNATGGYTLSDPVARSVVTLRKIGINSVTANEDRTTPDGKVVSVAAYLIAPLGSDIEINDIITIDDVDYCVATISNDPPWRLRAEVYVRG